MKYSHKNKSRHLRTTILAALLALLLVGAVFAYSNVSTDENDPGKTQTEMQDPEGQESDAQEKLDIIESEPNQEDSKEKDRQGTNGENPQPGENSTNSKIRIEVSQENSNAVTVQTKVDGLVDGECKLTVANDSTSKDYTAELMYQREFSSCAGYSIPINDIGYGQWNIKLTVEANENTYESEEVKMEVVR